MVSIEKFRESGYVYDSIENYPDLINFDDLKSIKDSIDAINVKRHSKYDYWFKYKELSYMEELVYDELLRNDKNLDVADEVYQKGHEYQIKKIEECGFYPTWVFGTSMSSDVTHILHNGIINKFQENFCKYYYSDKVNDTTTFMPMNRLQFYDNGCEIKLHDDGSPIDRICVFLYFLNSDWNNENGGQLILHTNENKTIKVNPIFPNFVVLDSDKNLFHEVEKVKNDMKYNIVSFLSYKNNG